MNDDSTEQWFLPAPLRMTNPRVLEASIQMQKELQPRAVSPFARLSPKEFERNRARSRIWHLIQSLKVVEVQLKTTRGRESFRRLKESHIALRARLAESFVSLGRYDLALDADPRPEYKEEYRKHLRPPK